MSKVDCFQREVPVWEDLVALIAEMGVEGLPDEELLENIVIEPFEAGFRLHVHVRAPGKEKNDSRTVSPSQREDNGRFRD